ncbi:pseudouridine synthase [Novosphingobium panipatense]|uniref:pseudouridine synthase n=1 Tax=Novosphingobium TaxID=165696 RepID=UPI000CDA9713|nr:pseudouridine synthase [Novosphingobium sp. HII-3]
MSKPPSRSGGSGRDGFSRGPRGGKGASGGGAPRGGRGERGAFGSASRDGGPRREDSERSGAGRGEGGGRGSRGPARREGPRIGSRDDFRDELPRRGPRDGGTRDSSRASGVRHKDERDARRAPGRSPAAHSEAPRGGPRRDARSSGSDSYRSEGRSRAPVSDHRGERTKFRAERRPGTWQESGRDSSRGGRQRDGYRDGSPGAPAGPRPRSRPGPAPRAAAPTPKDPSLPSREGERIAKLLARAGIASRREVERMIAEGRVKLGETVIDTPATVLTSLQGITVDGTPVRDPESTRLFLFHKPGGLITAERDPAGRPTIYTALRNALPPGAGRVMPIGRLDLNTEGLLLLTNDGEFKRQLELPATGVPRTYRARTFGDITQAQLEDLMEGIEVDGVIYGRIDANMERRTGRNQWIEMTLTEGKNREVRRVLEALGLQVSRLIRVAYGPFRLGDLPKGAAGEISQRDLENFRRTLPESKA